MKVLDLTGADFTSNCTALARRIVQDGFCPECVVGILNGGACVAKEIMSEFSRQGLRCRYEEIKLQRASTEKKKKVGCGWVLRRFPIPVCNVLRNVEAVLREIKFKIRRSVCHARVSDTLGTELARLGVKRVLVVDDAVDSGVTMGTVLDMLWSRLETGDVRSAVLTVTMRHPVVMPEYSLYRRVLLRFPWSFDAREVEECRKR